MQNVAVAKAGESHRKTVMSGASTSADKTRCTPFICSHRFAGMGLLSLEDAELETFVSPGDGGASTTIFTVAVP